MNIVLDENIVCPDNGSSGGSGPDGIGKCVKHKLYQSNLLIEPSERRTDGCYTIENTTIHFHPFTIEPDGSIVITLQQLLGCQDFAIEGWVSTFKCLGGPFVGDFDRAWSPGTGGITHIFYDENISPPPSNPGQLIRNSFSEITSNVRSVLVPLAPGEYVYNVLNQENRQCAYKINLANTDPTGGKC